MRVVLPLPPEVLRGPVPPGAQERGGDHGRGVAAVQRRGEAVQLAGEARSRSRNSARAQLAHVPVAQEETAHRGRPQRRVQHRAHEARVPEVGDAAHAARDAQRVHARELRGAHRFELRIAQRKKKGRVFFLFVRGGVLRGRATRAAPPLRLATFRGFVVIRRRGRRGVRGGRFHERSVFASSQNAARAEHGSVEVPVVHARVARRAEELGNADIYEDAAAGALSVRVRLEILPSVRPPRPCRVRARLRARAQRRAVQARHGGRAGGLRALHAAPRQRRERVPPLARREKRGDVRALGFSPDRVAARPRIAPARDLAGTRGRRRGWHRNVDRARHRAGPVRGPARRPPKWPRRHHGKLSEMECRRPISKKIGRAGIGPPVMVSAKTPRFPISFGVLRHPVLLSTRTTSRDSRTRRHHRRPRPVVSGAHRCVESLLFRASQGIWDALQHE